ncbi:MAG TPA: GAF domain-containing protein [Dehalococcoidales bacterium]
MNTLKSQYSYTTIVAMAVMNGFSNRIRLLTNLGILVWVSIVKNVSGGVRTELGRLLLRVTPDVHTADGLLVSTYENMRRRLRDSLREIEEKTQQLEESWEELKQSRDLLQTIIDSISADLIVIDRDLRITQVNRSMREKYSGDEVVGRYCYEVTHGQKYPCQSPDCVCPAKMVWQTCEPTRVVHVHRMEQNGNSRLQYLEIFATPLYDRNKKIVQIVELVQDVTKDKEQEQRILETNQALRALNTVAIMVSESLSLEYVLNTALDRIIELTRAEIGGILLLDEKTQTLSYKASRGLTPQFVKGTAGMAIGEGVAGLVAQEGTTILVDDAQKDPRISRRPIVVQEGLRGFLGVPLKSKERMVGVLTIGSRIPRLFTQQEVQFLTALGHQLGLAIENAQLYQELQFREQARADLLRQVIRVQEDERRRVARELHDVTSQALATLAVRVETIGSIARLDPKEADTLLEEIRRLLMLTSKEVHSLIYELRPSLLDDLGLPAAVRSCAHNVLEAARIEVHLEVVGREDRLPPEVEIAAFRITQEAITNIASHSKAESTYISLEFKDRGISVQVEDDGIGFNLLEVLSSAHAKESMGLLGMKERAELLGGTLNIDTEPGKGTRITVEIPLSLEKGDVQDKRIVGG